MNSDAKVVLDAEAIGRIFRRIASEIVEKTRGTDRLGLVGVRRGGVPFAQALAKEIASLEAKTVPVGIIDITLYRDDAATALPNPQIGPSSIDFDVSGRDIVLCDDVLMTGRTTRAAIDCLLDYGRPRRIWLAVLCDRGGRELPVSPDFLGSWIDVEPGQRLEVEFEPVLAAVIRPGKRT